MSASCQDQRSSPVKVSTANTIHDAATWRAGHTMPLVPPGISSVGRPKSLLLAGVHCYVPTGSLSGFGARRQ